MSSMLHDLFKPGFSTSKPGDMKNNSFMTSVVNAPLVDSSSAFTIRELEKFAGSDAITMANASASAAPLDRYSITALTEVIKDMESKSAPKIERDVPQTVEDSW